MGVIINIDQALEQHATYNVLREPLNQMLTYQQEAWERANPIDLLFNRSTLDRFQKTFSSTIGFDHAFKETNDYAVAPIFNTAEGFSATYRTRTFQGGFIITQQTLEDGEFGFAKDNATAFMTRWHGDIVEYCMASIAGGFGKAYDWYYDAENKTRLKLDSADTVDGDVMNANKVALFSNAHTIVARDPEHDSLAADAAKTAMDTVTRKQSNLFYADLKLGGDDAGQIAKLADVINQVITYMENLRDDNGKRAGVIGAKTIVTGNDPRLKGYIEAALKNDTFGTGYGLNPAMGRATLETTPYLMDIPQCAVKNGCCQGFFIVDKAYNAANHGLELTERIPLTLNVSEKKNPYGISYDGRQRFDVNVATWRGIAYVYIGTPDGTGLNGWDTLANFTKVEPVATIVKEVHVMNPTTDPVNTKSVG